MARLWRSVKSACKGFCQLDQNGGRTNRLSDSYQWFCANERGSGVGRTGLIAVVYFEIVSTIALLTGLVLEIYLNQAKAFTYMPMLQPQ